MDKAGQKYWSDSWAASMVPDAVDPTDTRIRNYVNRRFDREFRNLFAGMDTTSMRLLEIGCARSAWLPYFAKEFDFEVTGLDYSPIGCEMAREVLLVNGLESEVICADLFTPPEEMLGSFDVVVSFGVVEHFDDTAYCLQSVASFLKPGGTLITSIPNMTGWIGALTKIVNKPNYDIHQIIDSSSFRGFHELAQLEVVKCNYFISTSFGVANLEGLPPGSVLGFLKKVTLGSLARLSMFTWLLEERVFGDLPAKKWASPFINCVSRKI